MGSFNLVDFGNIGEPTAEVINNFVNKISSAMGWAITPKNVKPAIIEANKSIIEEITHREDIHPLERAAIVNNYKKVIREYKNQMDIVQMAIEHLNPDCRPEYISNDWIMFFFEKVKDITENDVKIILAKILVEECKNNTIPKQLLNVLSLMEKNDLITFNKICNLSIRDNFNNEEVFFIYDDCLLQEMDIHDVDLLSLESIGLIKISPNYIKIDNYFEMVKKTKVMGVNYILTYGNTQIEAITNDWIPSGDLELTLLGEYLKSFLELEPIDGYEKYIVKYLKEKIGNAEIINMQKTTYENN